MNTLSDQAIGLLSLLATLACYAANKRMYRRHPHPLLMPIIATPLVLIALALLTHVRYPQYIAQTHWLVWLLGPTTVAFALPLHENRQLLRKHWMSIATGVIVASGVSIATTVWFAQAFGLPVDLQKGLAVRSVTTPFAIEAERVLGGPTDLAALFVLLTGVRACSWARPSCGCCPGCAASWLRAPFWAVRRMAAGWRRRGSLGMCRRWWLRW
jgi:putative effector of murein hydrolase